MAAVYYVAARRQPLLWRRPLVCGSAYGLVVYVIMDYVVVPLSAARPGSKDPLFASRRFRDVPLVVTSGPTSVRFASPFAVPGLSVLYLRKP